MRAIPAIFKVCPITSPSSSFEVNPAVLTEALELVDFASRYDPVMYCFELADANSSMFVTIPWGTGRSSAMRHPMRVLQILCCAHMRETSKIVEATAADLAIAAELAQQAKEELNRTILYSSPDAVDYTWTPTLLAVAEYAEYAVRVMPWDFPQDLAVGNLTFGDVRKFWGALHAFAFIHGGAHIMSAQGQSKNIPRESILPVKRREEWDELIADIGGVAVGAVSELLWWYTFDLKVAEATAPIQPFFQVRRGYLAIPLSLVATSSVERNLQKILSRIPTCDPSILR